MQGNSINTARDAYLKSLEELKGDPANASLKQRTLGLGRSYSILTRDQKGQILFDEVALMNDINAACAASHAVQPRIQQPNKSIEERLRTLAILRTKGLFSGVEYASRREEILSDI